MKFRFDPNQEYQLEAIRSVADLFDGEPFIRSAMVFKSGTVALSALALTDELVADLTLRCRLKTI